MLDKDFDIEYNNIFFNKCPSFGNSSKSAECLKDLELRGIDPGGYRCHRCWREYIEQKYEPEENNQHEFIEIIFDCFKCKQSVKDCGYAKEYCGQDDKRCPGFILQK